MDKPIISTLLIVLVVLIVIWRLRSFILFPLRSVKAEGTIVNWMSRTEKGRTYYHPLIEFRTKEGATLKYRADEYSENQPQFSTGTKVVVSYDPKDPKVVKTKYPERNRG